MRNANISELRNHLSRYLDHVRKGGVVRIFDRDRLIAEIVPLGARKHSKDEAEEERLRRLEREGKIIRGTGKLPPDFFKNRPKIDADLVAAVSKQRDRR